MLKNYIKIAWRNLKNNKLFSILNIFGLAISLCVFILLALFIIQERSFDSFPNGNRIFRYLANVTWDGKNEILAGVPNAIGPTVKENIPEVLYSARTLLNDFGQNANINIGHDTYIESRLYWADPDILKIFNIHLLQGNSKTALQAPNTVVLSASKAKQYFGNKNAINQTIELNRNKTLTVAGVYADLPSTSTFDAEIIGSYSSTGFYRNGNSWSNASFETWIMLAHENDYKKVTRYLPSMVNDHVEPEDRYYTLSLQPLRDIHLSSANIEAYTSKKGDLTQLKQLGIIALALLLMAAINYMNLVTARAQQRSKEIGINKTLGASRRTLIGKFYAETGVLTFLAMLAGLLLAFLCVPLFNTLSGKTLEYNTLLHPLFYAGLPLLWLTLTLISGIYPAMILSSFSPIVTLQKEKTSTTGSSLLRKSLVIIQFSASIVLIVGVIVMYLQMNYIRNKKLGYNPENVLAISLSSLQSEKELDYLQDNIRGLNNVEHLTVSQALPGKGESGRSLQKNDMDKQGISLKTNRVIGNVQQVLQLHLLAGKMLTDKTGKDDSLVQVVLNKYAVDYLGFTPEEAIGKKVTAQLGSNAYVVGVVDNFNFSSLHEPISAYAFNNDSEALRYLLVRFKTGNLSQSMRQFEDVYRKSLPNAPFDYTFLDSYLNSLYQSDEQTASILLTFSSLAIFIGCLGLFGLAAFTAERRVKEIGVRKVLGASVRSIVQLLSFDFIKLVCLAFIIACPIAYWLFSNWLDNFAYKIALHWWMFGLAGLGAIIIALLTVSFQAIKAAVANPINSLRNE